MHSRWRRNLNCDAEELALGLAASAEVAAQHQRRAAAFIISLAAAHFAESGAPVEPAGRRIALADLEKHRTGAEAGQPPQMQLSLIHI